MTPATDINTDRLERFVGDMTGLEIELPAGAIGAQLQALRKTRGLTQVQVAERLGTEQTQVSRLENSSNPTIGRVLAYLHAVEASASELVVSFSDSSEIRLPLQTPNDPD